VRDLVAVGVVQRVKDLARIFERVEHNDHAAGREAARFRPGETGDQSAARIPTLAAGEKLGPYEILAPIGAGGMGEVYRARDTKLKRDLALKVLPDAFARDPGRMLHFQREAEVLASLNRPNIAHIYGVEERALVTNCAAECL
jgi:serine/threonine protein kinase